MFYTEEMDNALRFRDVLKGYFSTSPVIKEPLLKKPKNYNIDVTFPIFSVIIAPCCEIGNKTISLTSLIQVRGSFFDNPYLAEDLTRVNRRMTPEQAIPPSAWNIMPDEEKQRRLELGSQFAFLSLFVYEKHDLLPKYTRHRRGTDIKTNHYMIDFKNTHKLCCDKIISPIKAPLDSKVLQLSVETRKELREKIAYYYGRAAPEDEALED